MDHLLLSGAYLAMEAAWLGGLIAVWGRWIDPGERPALLPLAAVLLTLSAGFLAGSRLLRRGAGDDVVETDRGVEGRRLAIVLMLSLCWSLAVVWLSRHAWQGPGWLGDLGNALGSVWSGPSADLAALLATFFLWWRGQRAGAGGHDYATVVRSFGLGSLLLAAALVAGATALGTPPALAAAAPLFLAAGLASLTLGRLHDVRSDIEAGAVRGNAARISAGWARAASPPIVAVLIIAAVAAMQLGDEASRATLVAALSSLSMVVWSLLYWPLVLAGYVVEWLILLLRRLPPPGPLQREPQPTPDLLEPLRRLAEQRDAAAPGWVGALRWVALASAGLVVLGILFATSRVARREREARARPVVERQSLWSWRGAWLAWTRALLDRWRSHTQTIAATATQPDGARRAEAVDDVRTIYRRLLALGLAHGLPRRPSQTPAEYQAAWPDTLPGEQEVGYLTVAYEQVRYGPADVPAPPASPLRAALAHLVDRLNAPQPPLSN